jgi:hypothetical protein
MRTVALFSPLGSRISTGAPFLRKLLDDRIHPAALFEMLERLVQAGKPGGLTVGSGEVLFPPAKAIVKPRGPLGRQRLAIVGQALNQIFLDPISAGRFQ